MNNWPLAVALAAQLLFAVSCARKSEQTGPPDANTTGSQTNVQVFQVKGTVTELKLDEKTVRIKHEAIPGYMPAMTMPFEVKDAHELNRLEAGDTISFRLIVTANDAWIDRIKKLNVPANTNLPKTGPFRFTRDVEPLNVGDPLPDYRFTNELGQPVHLHQFHGQALAITFMFTRCPFPTFCPLMSGNFAETQKKLLAMTDGPRNWHLLTISFDPEFDTPPVLKAYAERYRYDPEHWNFLTGDLVDITAITEQLGLAFWHDETGGISHNLRTVVVDARGRVQRIFNGNKWTCDELALEIVKAAAAK